MASYVQNMRMATLYPTGNRGENNGGGEDIWNEFENRVIPAMQRKRQEDQRYMEFNELRHQNKNRLQSGMYDPKQMAQNVTTGIKEGPNDSRNSMMDAFDARNDKDRAFDLSKKTLDLKERTLDENIGFKYNKQGGDLALKQQLADLKIPEEEKLRLMNQYGLERDASRGAQARQTEGVKQTGRIAVGAQRGDQKMDQITAQGGQTRLNQDNSAGNSQSLAELQGRIRADAVTNKPIITSPYQANIALNSKAKQLFDQNPEWQKYIIRDEKGGFTVTPPGTNGMDALTHERITGAIYGNPRTKDIQLPTDKKKTTPAAPVSKYKVTVK